MDVPGLHAFLGLIEGRPDDEIAHVMAVVAATTQHMDQQKEHAMAKSQRDDKADYGHAQNEQERRRSERQGQLTLEGLGNLARLEAHGLDTAAQREALGLDGKGR
jgi:hypothetical protein